MKIPENISKRFLWRYVNIKIKRSIHHYHVFGVLNILFEEIINDLKNGNKIDIFNFGILELKKLKPRNYHNVTTRKWTLSSGNRIMRFVLDSKIKRKICEKLDLDLTFGND